MFAQTSAAETVKLLQSASAAASGKKMEGAGGDGGSGGGETSRVVEGEDDNVVTTIDEVHYNNVYTLGMFEVHCACGEYMACESVSIHLTVLLPSLAPSLPP